MINMILACDKNGCIGKGNKLPWHLPEDLKRFKELTEGSTVVMGRKTYESLPMYPKGLPGRRNVVLSTTLEDNDHIEVIKDLHDYLNSVMVLWNLDILKEDVWIIGGAEVYHLAMPYISKVVLTEVDVEVEDGDTWFNISDYPHLELTFTERNKKSDGFTMDHSVLHYRAMRESEL